MSLENIDQCDKDLIKYIPAENIDEQTVIIVFDIVLNNVINDQSENDIQKDQISRELSVIDPLAESFVFGDRSPSRPVEYIYSQNAKEGIINGHDKKPERVKKDRH